MEFHGDVEFGRNSNWRPANPGFPARSGSWLWFEGLRRKLGRLLSFGCGDLKSMKGSAQIRPANGRSSRSAHGVGRERKSEPRERAREWARVGEGRCATLSRGGDRRTTISKWLKQSRRGPFAVPKRTVRKARCYTTYMVWLGGGSELLGLRARSVLRGGGHMRASEKRQAACY